MNELVLFDEIFKVVASDQLMTGVIRVVGWLIRWG